MRVAAWLATLTGCLLLLAVPSLETRSGRKVNPVNNTVANSTKAKEVLGLQFTPVESTIRDMVESSILLGLYTPDLSASL